MKYIPFLFFSLLLLSCKSYKLSNSDLAWNPYKVGNRLIFKSNSGAMDTIVVQKMDRNASKNEQYSPGSGTSEQFAVLARLRVPYNLDDGSTQLISDSPILAIIAGKDGTVINLMLNAQNSIFPNGIFSIKKLEQQPIQSKMIGGKMYNDLIVLKAGQAYPDGTSRFTDVLYWSKSKGYARFDVNATEYWELISF